MAVMCRDICLLDAHIFTAKVSSVGSHNFVAPVCNLALDHVGDHEMISGTAHYKWPKLRIMDLSELPKEIVEVLETVKCLADPPGTNARRYSLSEILEWLVAVFLEDATIVCKSARSFNQLLELRDELAKENAHV